MLRIGGRGGGGQGVIWEDAFPREDFIAQNAYCSWDIYLQSSYNHRSVILPVLLELSAFDWLMITRAFFHWEYLLLIKVQEVEQRDNTYARHC